ncbi:MAG: hypothetical protein KIT84_42695 [Labilithrix sp.]|nr:hypothetical protein [Labilithrix sp.]MCW5817787.1 hypothetical protein [Labilithrix sp.]
MKLRLPLALVALASLVACAAPDTEPSSDDGSNGSEPELVANEGGTPRVHEERRARGPRGTTKVATETGGAIELDWEMIDGVPITEGDVIVPTPTELMSATMTGRRWPGGVVPYVIDANLPDPQRVHDAIAHWHAKTNVRLVARTNQSDYLSFRPGTGCSAHIGKQGGMQGVNLSMGEVPSSVVGVGINRSNGRTYYFFRRGFATIGSNARVDAYQPHFKYTLPGTLTPSNVVEVAFANDGHLFAWYTDGTVSEGTPTDFAAYRAPAPYTLADGKVAADVAAIAISRTNQTHVFYKDGTFTIGTPFRTDATAAAAPFAVAPTKTIAQLAHVDVASNGDFFAYYTDGKTSSGTPADLGARAALATTAYPGHCAVGQTIHEIGHAVGLYHEQTRQDRDRYVTIKFENIESSSAYNFNKYSASQGRDVGPYDYESVMHYGSYSFSKNGQATILKKDGGTISGQRLTLSTGDVAALAGMYPPAP